MRLESKQPESESEFFADLHKRTASRIFYERVEPADESGFPDIYFVIRNTGMCAPEEGTIELKYARTELPNLRALARGTQKAAVLEYHQAGGRRRFALCWCRGYAYLWNTQDYAKSLREEGRGWTSYKNIADPDFPIWLRGQLAV